MVAGAKRGKHQYGAEPREMEEAKARRVMARELDKFGWTEAGMHSRAKGDPVKMALARRLRAETTMTGKWIGNPDFGPAAIGLAVDARRRDR